ncbi:MAG TPA: TetR/AcrR family transcriptional regulator [Methanosarcina sp.]|nr:TetR/AcrR family transcriptional regulator [Methanosarcina sp.]
MATNKVAKVPSPETHDRILDAAISCVKRWGVEKVTLNDIAQEAGVTRPTVYSYFGNRDEVIQVALLRSAYTFSAEMLKHISKFESVKEKIIESVIYSLKKLPNEPALALLKESSLAQIINTYALRMPEGNEIRRSLFKFIMNGKDVSDEELEEIIEVATRFVLSLLTLEGPKKRTDKELRGFLERRLLPALGINE